jgi:hypothetical protein
MMAELKDFKLGTKVLVKHHEIVFSWCDDPAGGYSFDADENDEPIFDKKYYATQKESYDYCITRCERFEMTRDTRDYEHSYWDQSEGICPNCGKKVYIERFTWGTKCECGRMYGDKGESVNWVDRSSWEDFGGESYCGEHWD